MPLPFTSSVNLLFLDTPNTLTLEMTKLIKNLKNISFKNEPKHRPHDFFTANSLRTFSMKDLGLKMCVGTHGGAYLCKMQFNTFEV